MVRREDVLSRRAAREQLRLIGGIVVRVALVSGLLVLSILTLVLTSDVAGSTSDAIVWMAIGAAVGPTLITLAIIGIHGRASLREAGGARPHGTAHPQQAARDLETVRREGRHAQAAPAPQQPAPMAPQPMMGGGMPMRRSPSLRAVALVAHQPVQDIHATPDYGRAGAYDPPTRRMGERDQATGWGAARRSLSFWQMLICFWARFCMTLSRPRGSAFWKLLMASS